MNLALWLSRTAALRPDAAALFTGQIEQSSYAAFARRAAVIASGLQSLHGVEPGDRIALFLHNSVDYLPLLFGIWAAGAVAVPINAKLHPREAGWIIADAGARIGFVEDGNRPTVEKASLSWHANIIALGSSDWIAFDTCPPIAEPVERGRDDLAWLFYTSGTTGRPKGVMLSNGNLHAMTYAYLAHVDAPVPGSASVYAAPLSHGAGLYSLVHVLRGSAHVIPVSGGFDAAELLHLGRHFGDVSFFAAPTMVKRLVDHARATGADGSGLSTIVYGGGPMYTADIEVAVSVLGSRFVQIYGQGETPMTATVLQRDFVADRSHPRWRERLASVGTAQSCVDVRVTDAEGRPLPCGETGEVLVRGATVMLGYWNNPDATAQTIQDGWLRTGDMGALDKDGFLTLKDRSKDVIISGGTNIYPREVEEVLLTHPDVAEACVLGSPHPDWGEEVVAFIVTTGRVDTDIGALDRHLIEQIARFKRPKRYRFVEELPKNSYGKVLKTVLREQLASELEES